MTVSSKVSKVVYRTNPDVNEYSFPFKVFKSNEVAVVAVDAGTRVETDFVPGADFNVSGLNQDTGGKIILTQSGRSKAGTGNNLVITRNMEFIQDIDLRPHDIFPAETLERKLDSLTMQDQQILAALNRAMIAPPDQDKPLQYSDLLDLQAASEAAAISAKNSAETAAISESAAARDATEARAAALSAGTSAQTASAGADAAGLSAGQAWQSEAAAANSADRSEAAASSVESAVAEVKFLADMFEWLPVQMALNSVRNANASTEASILSIKRSLRNFLNS